MKFALIILLALVAITTQQYYRPISFPQSLPRHHQPVQQHDFNHLNYNHLGRLIKSNPIMPYRFATPWLPITYPQRFSHDITDYEVDHHEDEEFPDTLQRTKGGLIETAFKYPSRQLINGVEPRFYWSSVVTYTNPFLKTATFTSTSTATVCTIKKCIPSTQFSVGSSTVSCNRKRRAASEADLLLYGKDVPTKVIHLTPTSLPSLEEQFKNNVDYQLFKPEMLSSKDEDIVEESPNKLSLRQTERLRDKRLFTKNYVVTTTLTSYTFSTTTYTTSVSLATDSALNCIPSGYVVC